MRKGDGLFASLSHLVETCDGFVLKIVKKRDIVKKSSQKQRRRQFYKRKGKKIVQAARSLYGSELLQLEDLVETELDYPIELSYYKLCSKEGSSTRYGVEIVKTNYLAKGNSIERKRVNLFTDNEKKTNRILNILKKNKVTPVGLRDTMIEIIKQGTL